MEFPKIEKKWKKGINALNIIYPNKYYGGVYNLAVLIVYNLVNSYKNWICNRVFLDRGKINTKLFGFTFQYELDYYNFLKILKENRIEKNKHLRKEIIFAGGPCINSNPFFLKEYVDFFVLGDAEAIVPKLINSYEEEQKKENFLERIAKIEGVFVPEISKRIRYKFIEDLSKTKYPIYQPMPLNIDKRFVFGKSFLLEIERGCPFRCKFCTLPSYYKNVRKRNFEVLKKIIEDGINLNRRKKVVIYSASFVHKDREKILNYLLEKNLEFSIPSLRVENTNANILGLIRKGGQTTLTIAPECDEELRQEIGKKVSDEKYFKFAKIASKLGFKKIKMYFMIGLPNQTDKEILEMVKFIKNFKREFKKIYVSVNPFVPKPRTLFEDYKMDKKTLEKQRKILIREFSFIGIKYKIKSVSSSLKEWKLAFRNYISVVK